MANGEGMAVRADLKYLSTLDDNESYIVVGRSGLGERRQRRFDLIAETGGRGLEIVLDHL
jgi:hypothetical protein